MSKITRRKSWGRPRDATDEKFLQQIEKILDTSFKAKARQPDWQTNLSLCDLVNQHPDRLSELTVKALERRLKREPPNQVQRLHGLVLLDMLVKNCGPTLHKSVAHPDFVATLLQLAGKKVKKRFLKKGQMATKTLNYEKELVQDKVLGLFQAWGPLHKDTLPIFNDTYTHLRAKGVVFPEILPEDETPWLNDGVGGRARHESFQFKRREHEDTNIPIEIKETLESYKQASVLLEERLAALDDGDDAAADDIAKTCVETLQPAPKRVKKLIQEHVDDEKLLAILFLVHDKIEHSLELYEQRSGAQRIGKRKKVKKRVKKKSAANDDDESSGEEQSDDNSDDDGEGADEDTQDVDEWRQALTTSASANAYSTSNTLQIPSASDNCDSSIAIGLDYLASLSAKTEPVKQEDPFMDWLLGPPAAK